MPPNVAQQNESLLSCCVSCLACLFCWSCWRDILWALGGAGPDGYARYEAHRRQDVPSTPATAHSRQGGDERRRLLAPHGKLREVPVVRQEDPKSLRHAGVPVFPKLKPIDMSSATIPQKKTDHLTDFGDVCPTCLDPYTAENPKIMTKCGHGFHLACIYEWLERANTCPICFRPMSFDELQ